MIKMLYRCTWYGTLKFVSLYKASSSESCKMCGASIDCAVLVIDAFLYCLWYRKTVIKKIKRKANTPLKTLVHEDVVPRKIGFI